MLDFIILIVVISIILVLASNTRSSERLAEQMKNTEKRELEASRIKTLRDEFGGVALRGWEHITPASINGSNGFVAITGNGLLLRFVTYNRANDTFSIISDTTIAVRSILSFDVVIPERSKTITHNDKIPVVVKEGRSPVGRALVGGVLLGPVGAVVGAASGVGGKTKVEHKQVQRSETIKVKGPSKLVLGVQDLATPVLRIEFEPSSLSNDWWYRIQSARSRF